MRETKKSNAITLIALIITIIIMLILVAVTISILVKSNIIGIAESAADKTKSAYEKESSLGSKITIGGVEYDGISGYIQSKCSHNWGDWNVVKEPSYTEAGERNRECTKCGLVQTEYPSMLACDKHTYGENDWVIDTPATCKEKGLKYVICTTCSTRIEEEIEIDTENGHNFVDGTCTICGKSNLPEGAGTRYAQTGEYSDGTKTAMIPAGFTVSGIPSETTIDGGLVIYDIPAADLADSTKVDWTNPDTVKTKYNQFVWIPVVVNKTTEPKDTETSIASFRRSVWQDNARVENNVQSSTSFPKSTDAWSRYTEPYAYDGSDYDGTNGTGIAAQIAELTKSIYKYEGFYIGRYEAGVAGTTPRSSSSESQTAPFVVQQDKYPYNYIKWGTGNSTVSTDGAVYLSNNLYAKTNINYGATSMLCTGACWDAMLDFVKDSSHDVTISKTWGNYHDSPTYKIYRGSLYSSSKWSTADTADGSNVKVAYSILLTTGATDRNSSKNIYDVAGNCEEWTTETAGSVNARVKRGGNFEQDSWRVPACDRTRNRAGVYHSCPPFLQAHPVRQMNICERQRANFHNQLEC